MSVRGRSANLARRVAFSLLPASRHLAFDFAAARFDRFAELEMVGLEYIPAANGAAIDVGANQGWFTNCLARRFGTVHALEPNPVLADLLRRRVPPGVTVHQVAVSDANGRAKLFVPFDYGMELHGWGSLNADHYERPVERVAYDVETRRLDDFNFQNVALIKIDVEGLERAAINGSWATIRRELPTLIVEIRPPDQTWVREETRRLGYVEVQSERLMPASLVAKWRRANFIFVHPARAGDVNPNLIVR